MDHKYGLKYAARVMKVDVINGLYMRTSDNCDLFYVR